MCPQYTKDRIPRRADGGDRERQDTVGAIEHFTCALIGFAVTGISVVLLYPSIVAVAQVFQWFSSTAIVFGFALAWALTWVTFELAWEWQTGRLGRAK